MKVSVVLPIYNAAPFLKECLDSIISQTLTDIEIICENDGSTDNSLDILNEYASKDSRIKVFSHPNAGYGYSMNDGFSRASGEYVGIVEPDDAIKPTMLEKLYNKAKEYDLDWIRGDIYLYYSHEQEESKRLVRESITWDNAYDRVLNPQNSFLPYKSGMRTWSGIYKLDFLKVHGINHNETPGGSYQDVGFYLKTLYYATKVYFLKEAFYMWRQDNPASSIHLNSKKLVEKSLTEWHLNYDYLNEHSELGKIARASYHYRKFYSYRWTLGLAEGIDKKTVVTAIKEEFSSAINNNEIDRRFYSDDEWMNFLKFLYENKINVKQLDESFKTNTVLSKIGKLPMYVKTHGILKTIKVCIKQISGK